MTINLGTTADVRRITGFSSTEIDDSTIVSYLDEADRKIRAQHFQKYMMDMFYANIITQTGMVNTAYELYFPIKTGNAIQLWLNGVVRTLTTDYTVSGNILTFTSAVNLFVGDKIQVYYCPEFFDDYANYIAAMRLLSRSVLDSSNGVMIQNYQIVQDNVKFYEKMLAQKPHVARAVDHCIGYGAW